MEGLDGVAALDVRLEVDLENLDAGDSGHLELPFVVMTAAGILADSLYRCPFATFAL